MKLCRDCIHWGNPNNVCHYHKINKISGDHTCLSWKKKESIGFAKSKKEMLKNSIPNPHPQCNWHSVKKPIEDTKQSTLDKYKNQIDNDSRHFLEFGDYIKSKHAKRILEDFANEINRIPKPSNIADFFSCFKINTGETQKPIEYKNLPDSDGYWLSPPYGIVKVKLSINGDFYFYSFGYSEMIRCRNVNTKWTKVDISQYED